MIDAKGKIKGAPLCPNPDCRKSLNGFTGLDGKHTPKEGDISICAYCAEVCEFDFEHHAITLKIDKYNKLPDETKAQINVAQQAIFVMMQTKH